MFGRKKASKTRDSVEIDDTDDIEAIDDADDDAETTQEATEDESPLAKWDRLDASKDWRENGPFDIDEVDLDADDVARLDFGALVVTPVPNMKLQLQLNQDQTAVQALMVTFGDSALEIALFAAPALSTLSSEVRNDMIVATQKAKGEVRLAEGPFGTEIRRVIPMKAPSGQDVYHVSRTWLTEGPGWLLRGVVMGKAANVAGIDGISELPYEFFANLVVRRPEGARVPGSLIALDVPDELKPKRAEADDGGLDNDE